MYKQYNTDDIVLRSFFPETSFMTSNEAKKEEYLSDNSVKNNVLKTLKRWITIKWLIAINCDHFYEDARNIYARKKIKDSRKMIINFPKCLLIICRFPNMKKIYFQNI